MLHIYNTMTGKKEPFKQLSPDGVRMYVCGVTVYDLCHVGHARSAIAFDVIRRGLEWLDMPVIFVKNFTDIDDKIINKANETGKDWKDITEYYIKMHNEDMAAIFVKEPTHTPRATEFIQEMVEFCERLIHTDHAYVVGGDVYYRVKSFKEYGKLSNRNIDDLLAGARVEINEDKESPVDFALWKSAKPGEPSWDSPWGKGRPGWHLECSVMSEHILGVPIDIHGGGQDLIFPHHENEIAQSEAACGCEMARFWVHNGFVNIDDEKMSKSLGNFFTIKDILKDVDPEVLRFFLLSTHYRQPLEFNDARLFNAEQALGRIYNFKDSLKYAVASSDGKDESLEIDNLKSAFDASFGHSIKDDFNTPAALAALFEYVRGGNRVLTEKLTEESLNSLREESSKVFADAIEVMHVAFRDSSDWYDVNLAIPKEELKNLIKQRNDARATKDFATSDKIRDDLVMKGIELIDTVDGTRYKTRKVRDFS